MKILASKATATIALDMLITRQRYLKRRLKRGALKFIPTLKAEMQENQKHITDIQKVIDRENR